MDFSSWAAAAGIGGIALGVVTLVFRDIIAKNIFSNLPAKLTYKLLRLIVVCAFVLGLVGTLGYVWLQNAAAAAKPALQGSLEAVLDQLSFVQISRGMYTMNSLNRYSNNPTPGNWALVRADFQRTTDAIEAAKKAIVNYNVVTRNPVDLTRVNTLLGDKYAVTAPYLRPDASPPVGSDLRELDDSIRSTTSALAREIIAVREKLR
jgi:hypothetical protein